MWLRVKLLHRHHIHHCNMTYLMGAGYEERHQIGGQPGWLSFLIFKFAQTWNWFTHKLKENVTSQLKLSAEKLMKEPLSEQEQSATKQIKAWCQRNDIWELNHFGGLQSGIAIPLWKTLQHGVKTFSHSSLSFPHLDNWCADSCFKSEHQSAICLTWLSSSLRICSVFQNAVCRKPGTARW